MTHGTVVVCMGNTEREHTFLGKDGTGDIKAIAAYLNKRIWEIPEGVEITVRELRSQKRSDWPRSEAEASAPAAAGKPDRRTNNRVIRGAKHFVVAPGEAGKLGASGAVKLSDGSVVEWFLWEGERPAVHSYAQKSGYIAALYRNELYDVQTHVSSFRTFGVTQSAVRERLTLIVRPPHTDGTHGVYPDTARNALKIQGTKRAGEPLPWADWGQEFAEAMPQDIRDALVKAGPAASSGSIQDGRWRERLLTRFGPRWLVRRPGLARNGTEKIDPAEPGPRSPKRRDDPEPKPKPGLGAKKQPAPKPHDGPPKFGAKNPAGATAKKVNTAGGLPSYRWSSGDDVEPGSAAAWAPNDPQDPAGVVVLSRAFTAFVEVKQYWRDQFADHLGDQVDETVEEVYGEAMVGRIAHSEQLVHDANWGKARVEQELRNPMALTMAALGLISEDHVIAARLTAKLGRRRERAA